MLPTEWEYFHQDCLQLYLEMLEGHQKVSGSNILIDVGQQRENVWINQRCTYQTQDESSLSMLPTELEFLQ